ncbi:CoA-acylating methylmalonate-semialdehyde dehydrogenase [Tsukamurella asaccharolytica]|uniref:methylmalonate-semialdehyde dehydrogenase (CoA acylating) n=1 Tax=Tsukamurella asaccharolytica TaxID=2592067 RepID=A0A5C5RE42_9ACTN|nr:CoA-acylating methylmalonate-semialdehyde dehydrogenase [Tsukamurella asaccharolytica]TWS21369.1 CoA-acylating methylmalonate-semialdehyde dehydrogenase [Tsukamurella asaccharolytica]
MRSIPHWINGAKVSGSGDSIDVLDPATDRPVATVDAADPATVDAALAAAAAAFDGWALTPLSKRAAVLYRFRDLMIEHRTELAALITAEHGKTLDDAAGEVGRAVDSIELACGGPALVHGRTSLQTGPNIDTKSVLHPVGVCLGITPFNFPAMMGLMMASVALAAGNCFIWKPSEQDPGVCIRIAELLTEAGLPDGVMNVVNGRQETVEQLIDDPRTQAVSFVGSSRVAQQVYARAAAAGKRVQTFGGAKNHMVVMPDADTEVVADQLASSAFGAAGQRCMAISVAVIVGPTAEPILEKVAERANRIRVGAGITDGTEVGPVVSRAAQERIRSSVKAAIADGARAVVDRSTVQVPDFEDGYFVGPTVLTDVALTSPAYQEELFGPVLVVHRVDTLDEALELIKNHQYGNGASIFTQDGAAVAAFEHRVSAGMVGVNVAIPVPVAAYAVQGWKSSAFGDTGLNNASWSFYTRPKYITSRWDSVSGTDFGFRPN